MRNLPLILASLALAACQTCPVVPPKVVHVTVEKLIEVPDELTGPCWRIDKRDNSLGEAVRLANARAAALEECSSRMQRIRNLAPAEDAKP